MAKNLGREFATMDEDERRRFAMEPDGGTDAVREELDFGDPRHEPEGKPAEADGSEGRRAADGPGPEAA